MKKPDSQASANMSLPLSLALAGVSNSCGAAVTHPFDSWKVRVQLRGAVGAAGALRELRALLDAGGWRAMYRGLSWALAREASYSALRVGLYERARCVADDLLGGEHIAAARLGAGAATGAFAAALTSPLDLLKVRAQASAAGAPAALIRDGGLVALWRGVGANVQRAAAVTAAQLSSYDGAKRALSERGMAEGLPLHASAAMIAGIAASAAVAPLDLAKSRIMAAPSGAAPPSVRRVLLQALRDEGGPRALMRGFSLAWLRLGPHTIVSFAVLERLRVLVGVQPL